MIWCNYESKKTIIYYNKKIVKVDYILTSTFIIINDILCNKHELLTKKPKTLYKQKYPFNSFDNHHNL